MTKLYDLLIEFLISPVIILGFPKPPQTANFRAPFEQFLVPAWHNPLQVANDTLVDVPAPWGSTEWA